MSSALVVDEECLLLMERVNAVKNDDRKLHANQLTLIDLLKSNYLNQLLTYISLYLYTSNRDRRNHFLQLCEKDMFILGFSTEKTTSLMNRLKDSDASAGRVVNELCASEYLR